MQRILLFLLALLLCLPFLFKKDINPVLSYDQQEKFDSRLSYINTVQKLISHTDSIAFSGNIKAGTYEYAAVLESVISNRFYHGFSHFTLSENWVAAVSGKWLKEDYACKVQPEAIMQQSYAACSQQSLVMMAVLRKKGMNYRSVGFPHHYAMEVQAGNEWYFFDANMEPSISKENRSLAHWQHQNDYLKKFYDSKHYSNLDYQFGKGQTAIVGAINEEPAKNARLFHAITAVLSAMAWCLPLLLMFYRFRLRSALPFISLCLLQQKPSLSLSA